MGLATVTQGFPLQEYLNVYLAKKKKKKRNTLKAKYEDHICKLNV